MVAELTNCTHRRDAEIAEFTREIEFSANLGALCVSAVIPFFHTFSGRARKILMFVLVLAVLFGAAVGMF